MALLLHGDAPFGLQGFVICALAVLALVVFFNEIARSALTKVNRKPKPHKRRAKDNRKPNKTSQTI
jgi:hypothetical protein